MLHPVAQSTCAVIALQILFICLVEALFPIYSAPRISFAPSARKHILHVNEAYANQTEFGLVGAFVKYTT